MTKARRRIDTGGGVAYSICFKDIAGNIRTTALSKVAGASTADSPAAVTVRPKSQPPVQPWEDNQGGLMKIQASDTMTHGARTAHHLGNRRDFRLREWCTEDRIKAMPGPLQGFIHP